MKLNGWWRLYVVYVVSAAIAAALLGLHDRSEDVRRQLSLHELTIRVMCMDVGPGATQHLDERSALDRPFYVAADGTHFALDQLEQARGLEDDARFVPWTAKAASVRLGAAAAECHTAIDAPLVLAPFWPNFLASACALLLTLALPVLIIGLVVRWVARGFRHPDR